MQDSKPSPFCTGDRVCGAAGAGSQITQAAAAVGDEVAVSLLHTAGLITLGCVDQLIGLPLDQEIDKFIPERPAPGLVPAGQDENQTDCRIERSQPENALCR